MATDIPLPDGDDRPTGAIARLVGDHYADLRALAERQLLSDRRRVGFQSLSPTSLLGETFTRMLMQRTDVQDKDHLSAIATMLFVRVLADRRRRRLAAKRGGRAIPQPLDSVDPPSDQPTPADEALLATEVELLHEKLAELAHLHPRRAEVLSLRLIGGLPIARVAEIVGVSVATVERDLALARAWLAVQMQ